MRRMPAAMVLALAAGVCALAASATAQAVPAHTHYPGAPNPGSFGVLLADIPVAEATNPRARQAIIDVLRPGTIIHRRIMVANQEPHTARFSVYAGAATIRDGSFIGGPGAAPSELTTWITVQHPVLRLRSYTSAMDMITIAVPRIATHGEHYGVIWAQQAAVIQPRKGVTIKEINRVGIRIYLTVSHGYPPVNFVISSLTAHLTVKGQPEIIAHVNNPGGQAVDVTGTARLTGGPGGISAGPYSSRQTLTLAPGQSGNVIFLARRGLPNGPWQVRVRLVSGLTVRTATAVLSFTSLATTAYRLPFLLGAGGLVAALAAVGIVLLRRGRRVGLPA